MNIPTNSLITPSQHEKSEWSRMATAAYCLGLNNTGHTYSTAASLPGDCRMAIWRFDQLQEGYRHWLICGFGQNG